MRTCSKCGVSKPHSEFAKGNSPDGLHYWCKTCCKEYKAASRKNNPDKHKQQDRKYNLKSNYDLTPCDYTRMLIKQGGVCASCFEPPKPGKKLCVDHDHETGEVRALLCHECNTSWGLMRESVRRCELLADYGRNYGSKDQEAVCPTTCSLFETWHQKGYSGTLRAIS